MKTRRLTEYERGLLVPALQQYQAAQERLRHELALLAGEAWKGATFDPAAGTLSMPPAPEEDGSPPDAARP